MKGESWFSQMLALLPTIMATALIFGSVAELTEEDMVSIARGRAGRRRGIIGLASIIGLGLEEAIKSAVDQLQKSSSLVPLSGSAGVQKGVSGAEAKNTPESG